MKKKRIIIRSYRRRDRGRNQIFLSPVWILKSLPLKIGVRKNLEKPNDAILMSHIHHPLYQRFQRKGWGRKKERKKRTEVKSNRYWACHNDKTSLEETDPWIKTRFSVNFSGIFIFYFSWSFLSSLMGHDAITLSRSII